jgi:hypothetical protein
MVIEHEQNFVYTATGSEGSDFKVSLPATRINDAYFVTASLAGVTSNFAIDLPNSVASDRTTTQFRVQTSSAPQSGDRIEFHVYNQSQAYFVDLAGYGVVTDDETKATANGNAISQAFAVNPANARFMLPMGKIYVNRDLAGVGIHRFAALRMTSLTDVVLSGWGPGATQLIMTGSQADGLSQVIDIYECTRVGVRDMTILHGPNLSNVDTATLQNHHIQITAATDDCTDVEIQNVHFGLCIGDAVRVVGSTTNNVVNGRVHHVTMRTGGHPLSPNSGARSGISFQKGLKGFELGNFYIHGAKNSPIDCEPSSTGTMTGLNIHDGVPDNTGGSTAIAISFGGYDATSLLADSRISNVNVIEGVVYVMFTENCTLDNVNVYASGQYAMAGKPDPLLYVAQLNRGTKLRNVSLTRDTNSTAGPLLMVQHSVRGSPSRIEIEGGEWLTKVSPGADAACVNLQDADRLRMRVTRLRVETASPASLIGIKVRPGNADITKIAFDDVVVESPNGLLAHALWIVSQTHNIEDVMVRGMSAVSAATNGVMFEAISGSSVEPYPILQGCDFSGCTNAWNAGSTAVGRVFPIVAGSKGGVCSMLGTVAPSGVVTALQGSFYTKQNGDSTQMWVKTSGTGNTGWTQLTIN